MTRGKVEHYLPISPYTLNIGVITLFFSSEYYMTGYPVKLHDIEIETQIFQNKHELTIEINPLALAIKAYAETEKRGFYIVNNNTGAIYKSIYDIPFTFSIEWGVIK